MGTDVIARRAVVRGTVQGVGYRWSTAQRADALGVTGWARNEADGTVTVWAQGAAQDVTALLEWCARGPRSASVDGLEVERVAPDAALQGFATA